jgi:hypothetical protein
MWVMPAMSPLAWRSPSTNRAIVMILEPCRSKKSSALSSRSGVRKTYLPQRSTSARPPNRPIAYPMLSPTTAETNPTTPTATTLSRPDPAKMAPAMSTVSPGTGIPKSSTRTSTRIAHSP